MSENANAGEKQIKLELLFSSDKMLAYVTASEYSKEVGADNSFDPQLIYDLASAYKVTFGIDDVAVKEFATGKQLSRDLELAHGSRPVNGKDGTIRYLFETSVTNAPKENDDGTVDYKELGLVQNVEEGDLLCKITMPIEGTPGTNVLGEEVKPVQGKPVEPKLGQGVTLSEDGLEVRAAIDGRVIYKNGTVEVTNVYNIKGDVGPETGNIRFNGSVIVQGNVLSDYSIFAKGDIVVNGYVEAAMLNASGNILIANGVNGMKKGLIKADGNITVKFAEMSKLVAGEDIMLDYSINSDLRANRSIIASGKKGSLLGGSCLAGYIIEAKNIGSEINTAMDLQIVPDWMHEVGFNLRAEERILNYQKESRDFIQDLEACEKGSAKMETELLRISQKLKMETDRDELNELKQKVLTFNQERTRLKEAIAKIEEKRRRLDTNLLCEGCKVVVKDIIHTGVRIIMGTEIYRINGHEKIKTYILEENEIKSYGITTSD